MSIDFHNFLLSMKNNGIIRSLAKNPLLNSQGLAVSNQLSVFSLNIKCFYHKQLIIKHKLIIKSIFLKTL